MSKQKKKSNKQPKEINPLVAVAIIGAVVAGGAFFVMNGDGDDYSDTASSAEHATTTIIEKVQAPDAVNAPMILPAQVKDLEVFNNQMSDKQHQASSAKLDASIAQSQLVVMQLQRKQIEVKRESMESGIAIDDFGMASSQPKAVVDPIYSNKADLDQTALMPSENKKSVDVVMTMKVNGERNALVKVDGENQRVSIGAGIDGTKYRVTNITDRQVCYRETGKKNSTQCKSV
ncbi:hypothetical protein [Photobacterium leiognathi]|uniref:hypothetical protein n=1 Tax=Photobacterium leiognathi TaxID=553611 RepID=UPI0029812B3C|nr:hypothetical protein [Photobacterium leiognathi]